MLNFLRYINLEELFYIVYEKPYSEELFNKYIKCLKYDFNDDKKHYKDLSNEEIQTVQTELEEVLIRLKEYEISLKKRKKEYDVSDISSEKCINCHYRQRYVSEYPNREKLNNVMFENRISERENSESEIFDRKLNCIKQIVRELQREKRETVKFLNARERFDYYQTKCENNDFVYNEYKCPDCGKLNDLMLIDNKNEIIEYSGGCCRCGKQLRVYIKKNLY